MNINLASIDYLREQFVYMYFIGMSPATFESYQEWLSTASNMNIKTVAKSVTEDSKLIEDFNSVPDATHIMIIDGTVSFSPWHILALLGTKKHFITGMNKTVVRDEEMLIEDDIIEVANFDQKFVLVSREALDLLGNYAPECWRFGGGRLWAHSKVVTS